MSLPLFGTVDVDSHNDNHGNDGNDDGNDDEEKNVRIYLEPYDNKATSGDEGGAVEPPHERPRLTRSERNYNEDEDDEDEDDLLESSSSVPPFVITARRIEQDLPEVKLEEVWENIKNDDNTNKKNGSVTPSSTSEDASEDANEDANEDDKPPPQKTTKTSPPRPQYQYWIDVEVVASDLATALPDIRRELLQRLPLSGTFMKRHLADAKQWQMPQVLTLHDAAFIVMRIIDGSGSSSTGSSGSTGSSSTGSGIMSISSGATEIRHAAALCLPHILVTLTVSAVVSKFGSTNPNQKSTKDNNNNNNNQYNGGGGGDRRSIHYQHRRRGRRHNDSVAHLMTKEDGRELPEANVSGCVLLWLGAHVQRTQTLAQQLRTHTYELTELAVDELTWNDIRMAKDTLLRLAAVVEEQNESCQAVAEGDAVTEGLTLDSSQAMMGAVRVLQYSAASTERMLTRLEKRLDDLAQAAEAVQQGRINGRLQALTILSAVFLPLTLMAGLWGMNFTDMPQLERDNAYYRALASMAAVALGLLIFFYRYGWLSSNMY